MIKFKLSVPNKLSLFGEHVMPLGYNGVVAGIELRTRMSFTEILDDVNKIIIKFPQIDLHFDKPLKEFLDVYNTCMLNEDKRETWHEQISQYITTTFSCTYHQKIILEAFFYLLICIAEKEKICIKSFKIYLSTQLKIDTVFPCPSSFAVCFAAGFLYWSHLQKGIVQNNFTNDDLKKIQCTASLCTKISSQFKEIDTIVCTYGSTIVCTMHYEKALYNTFNMPEMIILLIDSKQTQNLQEHIQRIAMKLTINDDDEYTTSVIGVFAKQTTTAMQIFEEIGTIQRNNQLNAITRYEKLMNQQQLLKNVSYAIQRKLHFLIRPFHDTLNNICSIAQKHDMFAKCTDIGDGRYAYVLCATYVSGRILAVSQKLELAGFDVTETTFSKFGLRIETNVRL